MAPSNKPVIGNLYDMKQQNKMHGGAQQHCAPTKDGEFTLLRRQPWLTGEQVYEVFARIAARRAAAA